MELRPSSAFSTAGVLQHEVLLLQPAQFEFPEPGMIGGPANGGRGGFRGRRCQRPRMSLIQRKRRRKSINLKPILLLLQLMMVSFLLFLYSLSLSTLQPRKPWSYYYYFCYCSLFK